MSAERSGPAICNVSNIGEGKDEMTKASIDLQDLRRRIYVKAKAEPSWRFWGLYVHVCKMETLRAAYEMAKRNDGAPGIDGVTFEAIEAQGVEALLEQLRDELIGRTYQPLPARRQEYRDTSYGPVFLQRIRAMGIRDHPIAPRSPWQNAYVERLIGSIRRECLDHMIVFGGGHLRRIPRGYAAYYNASRTHRSLNKDAPLHRAIERLGAVVSRPVLGGLHHQYCRIQFSAHTTASICAGAPSQRPISCTKS